ncbi:MAG: dinitrogenase iron-molybdenum cofactor biosynthesis protein [Anaerolineae bacterium]|nr:dinitrogenase iron-molybdenum cofactor biosynthesis protein [Anaerolineae bacterium]
MKIAVSSQGEHLDAPASPVFGRCPTYLFVEPETMEFEAVPNPAMNQAGGAGIQAAQFVVNQGADAVLSGNLGPNAYDVLQAAGVPGFLVSEGTVRQAVEAYKAGQLRPMGGPNVGAHAGMRGGGRGMGRRRQMAAPPTPATDKSSELAELRETLKGLRQQLAETMEKIEKLEEEG